MSDTLEASYIMDILWLAVRITITLGIFALRMLFKVFVPIGMYVMRNPHGRKMAMWGGIMLGMLWLAYLLIHTVATLIGMGFAPALAGFVAVLPYVGA